jgi:hypothetical protein
MLGYVTDPSRAEQVGALGAPRRQAAGRVVLTR